MLGSLQLWLQRLHLTVELQLSLQLIVQPLDDELEEHDDDEDEDDFPQHLVIFNTKIKIYSKK